MQQVTSTKIPTFKDKPLKKIGVIGAGVMGTGLTSALLETGHQVILIDLSANILEQSINTIRQQLRLAMMEGRLDRKIKLDTLLAQITKSTELDALQEADFVIENICEKWPLKKVIYPKIDDICNQNCVFASNTSAIPITRIAAQTQRPSKVIGIHFMNPVAKKPVVETIRGFHTSDETLQTTKNLLSQLGKSCIVVNDGPGFISNRISHLFMNEAIWVVQDQLASAQAVDDIFTQCYSHKTGPLATADLIGLDTILNTLEVLYQDTLDSKFRPAPLLRKMVDAGLLGRKSGHGFFQY